MLAAPSSLTFLHRQTLHPLAPFLIHVRLHVSAIVLPVAMQPLRRGDGGIFKYRPRITENKSSLREEIPSLTLDTGVERSDLNGHGGSRRPARLLATREFT
jgi:hypothetical protein